MGASLSSVWLVIYAWTSAGGVAIDHINFVNFAQCERAASTIRTSLPASSPIQREAICVAAEREIK
jgi:hypothetical protein